MDTPIMVVAGVDDPTGDPDGKVYLPLEEGAEPVAHTPCDFGFTRPGADRDGPTDGKLQIDNASDLLQDALKAAMGYNEPILITFRVYCFLPGELEAVTGPDEVIEGLRLDTVDLTADSAEGALSYLDGRTQNVPTGPDAFFDRENYPGLFA
ncbi:DUF1833 domain-containing protein [Methylobacterium sp. J-092]|nr:DUF1833 domain-containing protein [Methylobacterium sp. J-092]